MSSSACETRSTCFLKVTWNQALQILISQPWVQPYVHVWVHRSDTPFWVIIEMQSSISPLYQLNSLLLQLNKCTWLRQQIQIKLWQLRLKVVSRMWCINLPTLPTQLPPLHSQYSGALRSKLIESSSHYADYQSHCICSFLSIASYHYTMKWFMAY